MRTVKLKFEILAADQFQKQGTVLIYLFCYVIGLYEKHLSSDGYYVVGTL